MLGKRLALLLAQQKWSVKTPLSYILSWGFRPLLLRNVEPLGEMNCMPGVEQFRDVHRFEWR